MGALLEDIADTVHAHPTMTEAFHEGVLKTLGTCYSLSMIHKNGGVILLELQILRVDTRSA